MSTSMGVTNILLCIIFLIILVVIVLNDKLLARLKVPNICEFIISAEVMSNIFYGSTNNWIWIVCLIVLIGSFLIFYLRGDFVKNK